MTMSSQKQLLISRPYAQDKKDTDIRVQVSTELLQTLWLKEVISPTITELEENPFMEINSMMKTLLKNTINHIYCRWLMQEKIQMDHNSL
jgi:hypothetical protein